MTIFPAATKRGGEEWICECLLLYQRKDHFEVVFQQVFEDAACDRVAKVFVSRASPPGDDVPKLKRVIGD
ncbi:MAG: hypothetical protein KY475_07505 [Planctomycetes bacterium]|nr:hypothetical protein [Planctomycetota bacterium]